MSVYACVCVGGQVCLSRKTTGSRHTDWQQHFSALLNINYKSNDAEFEAMVREFFFFFFFFKSFIYPGQLQIRLIAVFHCIPAPLLYILSSQVMDKCKYNKTILINSLSTSILDTTL